MNINELKVNETYKKIIPRPTRDEVARLRKSIEDYGFLPTNPIVYNEENNVIIDGYSRYEAALGMGINDIPAEGIKFDSEDAIIDFIFAQNLHRRHLNGAQKTQVTIEYLKRHPTLSSRQIGRVVGLEHHTVEKVRQAEIGTGKLPVSRVDTLGRIVPQERFSTAKLAVSTSPTVEEQLELLEKREVYELGSDKPMILDGQYASTIARLIRKVVADGYIKDKKEYQLLQDHNRDFGWRQDKAKQLVKDSPPSITPLKMQGKSTAILDKGLQWGKYEITKYHNGAVVTKRYVQGVYKGNIYATPSIHEEIANVARNLVPSKENIEGA